MFKFKNTKRILSMSDIKSIKANIRDNIKIITEKEDFKTILSFLQSESVSSTENNNGTFVNLNSLNKKTLNKINTFINSIIESKKN